MRGLLTDRAVGHKELLKLIRRAEQVFIEPFVAKFDGPDLADPDKLREWWRENGQDADFLVDLVLDQAIAPLSGPPGSGRSDGILPSGTSSAGPRRRISQSM